MAEHKVLSVQEQRIQEEIRSKKVIYAFPNRAAKLLEKVKGTKPQIDIERGLYFTQSFAKTEGQPLHLRWAKALYHYAKNATVYIEEGQLLAGRS